MRYASAPLTSASTPPPYDVRTVVGGKVEKNHIILPFPQPCLGPVRIADDFNQESFLVQSHLERTGQKAVRFHKQQPHVPIPRNPRKTYAA